MGRAAARRAPAPGAHRAKAACLLRRAAFHELSRRRALLGSIGGPELDDLAQQAADDALMNILAKLDDFRGLSRFTTWAYKFVVFEVSGKVARHAWRRQPPGPALSAAIGELTERQREVFVAIALNEVPIDVLAVQLGTNRNAIYKNLFDARRNLRARMAAAGHPVGEED